MLNSRVYSHIFANSLEVLRKVGASGCRFGSAPGRSDLPVAGFGGSGDLGKEISKDLYNNGYNIVISHNKKNPNLVIKLNKKSKIYYKKCNFLSENSIKNFINYSVKKIGLPNLVINTVGIFDYENIKKINYKNIIKIFKINSLAVLTINKELVKKNKKKRQIKIISIGSSSSLDGF